MLATAIIFLETAASVVTLAGGYLLLVEFFRQKSRLYLYPSLILLISAFNISFVYLAQIAANLGLFVWAVLLFKLLFYGLIIVLFLAWFYLLAYFSLPADKFRPATWLLAVLGLIFSSNIYQGRLALKYYGNVITPGLDWLTGASIVGYSLVILSIIAVIAWWQLRRGMSQAQFKSLRLLAVSALCGFGVVISVILFVVCPSFIFYLLIWLFIFLTVISHFVGSYLPPNSPLIDHPLSLFRSKIMFKLVFLYTFLIILSIGLITTLTIGSSKKILAGEAQATIKLLETNYMVFAIVGIFGTFAASVILAWNLTRPISRIVAGLEHIKAGDLNYKVKVEGYDEIDQLASDFNLMTANLKAARAKNEDWNRELEAKVRERTEELTASHQQLQEAYQNLERTQSQLVQSAKLAAMGELVSGLTHDINNPLTSIVMYSELLQQKHAAFDDRTKGILAELKKLSFHLLNVSRNFLNFIRKTEPDFRPVDLAEVVAGAADLVHYPLLKNNVGFVFEPPADLPKVLADQSQLQQVFLNLFTNAVHAMPRGGRLQVEAGPAQEGKVLEIRVADTGSGIAPEVLPKIFEAFFTTRSLEEGTGLGLSICKGIIAKHHGQIEVASQPGQGTTFTLTLPAA